MRRTPEWTWTSLEREIVLTYVLRILADRGLLAQLAFKDGTAIRN